MAVSDERHNALSRSVRIPRTAKDGRVSPEESKAGKFSEHQFKAWDKNGDGMLDKSELDAMRAVKGKEGYCS